MMRTIPPPYKHQLQAGQRLTNGVGINPNVYALLMDMGTGKSRPIVRDFWRLADAEAIDGLVIIAPKGCYRNWTTDTKTPGAEPGELQKWSSDEELKRLSVRVYSSGVSVHASKELEHWIDRSTAKRRVLLINVESLSRPGRARKIVEQFVISRRMMIVVDEATCIMHADSARTIFVQDLGKRSLYRRILTGLVAPENPLNVFSQFWFLDWRILGFRNYFAFRARYAITKKMDFRAPELKEATAKKLTLVLDYHTQSKASWLVSAPGSTEEPVWIAKAYANRLPPVNGVYTFIISDWLAQERGFVAGGASSNKSVEIVVAYKNQEELAAKIAAASYRVLKTDVLDLPPKVYMFRDVELTDVQARMYNEMKKFATTELDGKNVTAEMKMHQIQKLHEIVCGHVKEEGNGAVMDVESNRIEELMSLLQDHSGKAIIWAPYPRALQKISLALKGAYGTRSTVEFWGETGAADRADAKYRIQQAEDTRFIVANPAVGGEGNTWTAATLTIYFANSRKNKDRQQSEDRPHRAGQRFSCTYVDLRARGTVDERWIETIRSKMDLADALNGDKWREWLI